MTHISNTGNVIKDIPFGDQILWVGHQGDSIFIVANVESQIPDNAILVQSVLDSDFNLLRTDTTIFQGLKSVTSYDARFDWVSMSVVMADSAFSNKVAFTRRGVNGTLADTLSIFNYPGSTYLYGFSKIGEDYLLWAEISDTGQFGNAKCEMFHLSSELVVLNQFAYHSLDYSVDTTIISSSQGLWESGDIVPIDLTSFYFVCTARNLYELSNGGSFFDADIFVGIGQLGIDTMLDYTVQANTSINAHALGSNAMLFEGLLIIVETRATSFQAGLTEESDSYVVISALNSDLDTVWSRQYLKEDQLYQRAEALTASKDQKYIILSGSEYDSTTDSARIFIMKLDVNGTLQVFEKSAIRTKGINSAYPNPTFNRVMLDINFSQLPRTLEL